jgi:hypothetical protein
MAHVRQRPGDHRLYPSVTRISDLPAEPFAVAPLPMSEGANGQYVVVEVLGEGDPRSYEIERVDGRIAHISPGDQLVGALGRRAATLQCVGEWESVESPARMDMLSIAGVLGRIRSCSPFVSPMAPLAYVGHARRDGCLLAMSSFARPEPPVALSRPVVLIIGTSMDAGKTTAAARIIRHLDGRGLRVAGVKLTGVGRYRDVLAMGDAGAEWIFDFVDAGIPSTVVPVDEFRAASGSLLARIDELPADVVVVEAGASPLEPYNGEAAVEMVAPSLRAVVLCASDPYAAVGVMHAFHVEPTFVAGRATCTDAGVALTAALTGRPALNLLAAADEDRLADILGTTLGLDEGRPSSC